MSAQTEVEWEGTYTVWSQDAYIYDDYVKNYLNLESLPQTFTVEIAKQGDDYVITKFVDFDLNAEGADGPIALRRVKAKSSTTSRATDSPHRKRASALSRQRSATAPQRHAPLSTPTDNTRQRPYRL